MMTYNPYFGIKYDKKKVVFVDKDSFVCFCNNLLHWNELSDEAKETQLKILNKIAQ